MEDVKLISIVVAYNPQYTKLRKDIESFISDVDLCVVWKNSFLAKQQLPYSEKIIYMGTENNVGLGVAYNTVAQYGITHGFTHLLIMDQDSCFDHDHFSLYKKYIIENKHRIRTIFSPNYNTRWGLMFPYANEVSKISASQGSGCIIPLSLISELNGFRESFMVYGIDHDFCFKTIKNGGEIESIHFVILHHEAGHQYRQRKFLHKTVYPNEYSPASTYYLVRNELILFQEYSVPIKKVYNFLFYNVFKRFLFVLLYEKNKFLKIKALFLSVYHGIIRKEGEYKY